MAVQYLAQHGDQPGEKLPPPDVGRIIMILMRPPSPIFFNLVVVAFPLMIEGWPFPRSLGVSSGSGKSGGIRWWRGGGEQLKPKRILDCSLQRRGCVMQRRRGAPGEMLYSGGNAINFTQFMAYIVYVSPGVYESTCVLAQFRQTRYSTCNSRSQRQPIEPSKHVQILSPQLETFWI